jgi:drug/metabolite transporter (DMT)-like permease
MADATAVLITSRDEVRERHALGALAAAVVLWSASALFVRAGHADPIVFTTWRLWFALPPLALVIGLRARRGIAVRTRPAGMSRRRWMLTVAGAGTFFASGAATAFAALQETRLLDVTLIGALQPVLIIAVAVAFLGERADRTHLALAVLAVAGTVLVAVASSGRGSWSLAGDLLAVLSLVLNVGWYLYGRVVRDRYGIDPFGLMFGVLLTAAIVTTPIAFVTSGALQMHEAAFGYAAATMAVGTSAHLLLVWAHRYVAASVSAPLLLAQPPLVAVAAWICFGEAFGPTEVLGSVVVVGALWGMVRTPTLARAEDATADPAPPA